MLFYDASLCELRKKKEKQVRRNRKETERNIQKLEAYARHIDHGKRAPRDSFRYKLIMKYIDHRNPLHILTLIYDVNLAFKQLHESSFA